MFTLMQPRWRKWISERNSAFQTIYAAVAAFSLYTCVYAFRKTFSAATFDDLTYIGIDYKVWLVMFQVVGYACSKFIGMRVIAELKPHARTGGILLMVSIAGLSWFGFGIVPPPYNMVFLLTNGLPLGLVWGMVFQYLEGRRSTDVLGASLAVSFIVSSGLCRSTGAYLLHIWHVPEMWMPLTAGALFLVPLLVSLFLLDQVPQPSPADELHRTRRLPMNGAQRQNFVSQFFSGLILIVMIYVLLTTYREFRDNFASDIWRSLGYGDSASIYTYTEVPISLVCLLLVGGLVMVSNNHVALHTLHGFMFFGALLIGFATYAFEAGWIEPSLWMTLNGLGLYLGYIPFNSAYFDRLHAAFRIPGTSGFVMYLADSFGYLGSVAVLLYKTFGQRDQSWLEFFTQGSYVVSAGGALLALGCMIYFWREQRISHQWAVEVPTLRKV